MNEKLLPYLQPTEIIDSDHPAVARFARSVTEGLESPEDIAAKLYLAVRDGIWYDVHVPFDRPLYYTASYVLEKKRSFCVPKASLLCALSRACNIPCRLGFADVRNHLASQRFLKILGTDVFVYHAFVEFYLNGKWIDLFRRLTRNVSSAARPIGSPFNLRDLPSSRVSHALRCGNIPLSKCLSNSYRTQNTTFPPSGTLSVDDRPPETTPA